MDHHPFSKASQTTHPLKCTGSRALWPLWCFIQVHFTQGDYCGKAFCFHRQKKTRGATFWLSYYLWLSVSLDPSEQRLSVALFSPPLLSISASERWTVERVHFQKQGKGSNFRVFFVCVSYSNTFYIWWLWLDRGWQSQIKPRYSRTSTGVTWGVERRTTATNCNIIAFAVVLFCICSTYSHGFTEEEVRMFEETVVECKT